MCKCDCCGELCDNKNCLVCEEIKLLRVEFMGKDNALVFQLCIDCGTEFLKGVANCMKQKSFISIRMLKTLYMINLENVTSLRIPIWEKQDAAS